MRMIGEMTMMKEEMEEVEQEMGGRKKVERCGYALHAKTLEKNKKSVICIIYIMIAVAEIRVQKEKAPIPDKTTHMQVSIDDIFLFKAPSASES